MTHQTRRQAAAPSSGPRLRYNLSVQPTPFLGREREIEVARQHLLAEQPPVRLLTLTGPGGTGKTRLALEIASTLVDQFADGVYVVDLAPVRDAQFLASAVARTLSLQATRDQPPFESLLAFLETRRVLLILDNFEQLIEAAGQLSQLLTACPHLKILVTSRARLRLRWERVIPVPPLEVPDLGQLPELEALARVPSVTLFLERARAIDPAFALTEANARAVAELCVRLDGLPLALELAAARVDVLTPQGILARLDRPLELLTADAGDVPLRHLTMRRAVGWSYDLLAPHEQKLFRRMAIFAAGCLPDGAAAVCGDDDTVDESQPASGASDLGILGGLSALASKSLLRRETQTDGELRFGMLETIRAFALEQLGVCGELEEAARRFRDFYLQLAEDAEPNLIGPDQAVWLDGLEREHDNLRAALRWCIERGAAEEGLKLVGALWRFWFTRRHLVEGSRWVDECLDLEGTARVTPETRAKALNGAGNLAHARGDLARAATLHQESLAVRQALGDRRGIAISLNSLANVAVDRGDYAAGRALHEESLALRRDLADTRGIAIALNNLGVIARDQGDWERAAALSRESIAVFRALGDKHGMAISLVTLGAAQYHLGSHAEATALHQQSLALFGEVENRREIAECLEVLAMLARAQDQPVQAARLFGTAEAALEEIGSSMQPSQNPRYETYVAEIRDQLGEDTFAAAWAEGRAMRLEDAIASALAPEPPAELAAAQPPRQPADPRGAARSRTPTSAQATPNALTRREQEVAALLTRGLTNRQIATELTITERTAETHVCKILSKLGLNRRAQLTAWAVERELISPRAE
jgi:predicted ATPase/DNA-binding CsgD family transcriptional regulator